MIKRVLMTLLVISATVAFAAEQTWDNVPLVDSMCLSKVKDNPDKHQTKCLVSCAGHGGIGIITSDGTFLKLDEAGTEKALALLKETDKKDTIRVNVTGEVDGDTVKVASVSFK